jgi:zinc protease
MYRRKLGWAAKMVAALACAAGAISFHAPLAAQDAPSKQETKSSAQKKGTGQVPAGVTLSPQIPPAAPPRPFQFPKAVTKRLTNGLRVFVIPGGKEPAVTVRLVLTAAGTVNDPQGKSGLAQMAAQLLTEGTATRSAQQIAEAIDFVGGSLSANSDLDGTVVTAQVVKKDFELAMELLADVVMHPAFQKEELERRRQQLFSNLDLEYADPNYLASAAFSRLVYGQHPYGLPEEGTPASARRLTREDLVRFCDEHYVPNAALLAFAGDVTPEAAFAAAEKYFGAWEKKELAQASLPAPVASSGMRIFIVDKPDAVQTQIRAGRPGIPRNSPDYVPLFVANRVFGGGFNSRLSTKVRQEKGLTYGAYSRLASHRQAGSFVASTSTRTETTAEAAQLVVELIGQMATGSVSPEELNFARDYLVGVFPIQAETPEQVSERVLSVAQFDLPADYYDTYRERIMAVGAEQVKEKSQHYFDAANLSLVLVGNAKAFREAIPKDFPGAKIEELAVADLDLLEPSLRHASMPGGAAPAATPESLAQGHALLVAAAQAAGGEAIAKVQSIEVSSKGMLSLPGQELPTEVRIQVVYPNLLRVDSKLPLGNLSQGFDGKVGWVSSPQGTRAVGPEFNAEFERGIALGGCVGIYRLALEGQIEAQYAGKEDVQGKQLATLVWNAPFGSVKLYLDPASHMVTAARFISKTPQGSLDSLQVWDDFRPVEGIQYPYHSITFRNDAKYNENSVQDVKLNAKPDSSVFAMPQ